MENVDSNAILLNCLNKRCSALILILKSFSVVMFEDFVLFKIHDIMPCFALLCGSSVRCSGGRLESNKIKLAVPELY